jgi:sec-independent protein translocase protein TatB
LLFIFQSIGTQELILIGIIALIFLGPRKLPEYARKIGKMMADLRNTTGEFRETWEREVNFEQEAEALSLESIEREAKRPAAITTGSSGDNDAAKAVSAPAIRELDDAELERLRNADEKTIAPAEEKKEKQYDDPDPESGSDTLDNKRNWL